MVMENQSVSLYQPIPHPPSTLLIFEKTEKPAANNLK